MRQFVALLCLALAISCASTKRHIGEELAAMRVEDQAIRKRWLADQDNAAIREEVRQLTVRHVARLRRIIEKHGWPTKAFGNNASGDAWLIAQHGGADMLSWALPMMDAAVKAGELEEGLYGTSLDRVRVQQGKKQVYGTQFDTKGDRCEPLPIEDPEHVDERRLRAGMTTLAEYTEQLCTLYKKQ